MGKVKDNFFTNDEEQDNENPFYSNNYKNKEDDPHNIEENSVEIHNQEKTEQYNDV